LVLLKAADDLIQSLLTQFINACRWLIKQKDVGPTEKRESNEQTLKLTA
jgi:hypothetical protein